ncbi:MAG: hypothetical protein IPP22_08420 [Nitrosomonas sp.]|nr:hypothetical protein [Nitrosomonas sp.]
MTDSGTQAANGDYTFAVSAKQDGKDIKINTLSLGSAIAFHTGNRAHFLIWASWDWSVYLTLNRYFDKEISMSFQQGLSGLSAASDKSGCHWK